MISQNTRQRYWIEPIGAFAFFFLSAAILTYPLVLQLANTLSDAGDALQQTWVLGWAVKQLVSDPLLVYEAPIFYPYPHTLAFQDSMLPQSIMTMPIALLTNNFVLAYNLNLLLALTLSGFNLYLLVRAWRGNFASGLVGGFIYAFASYHFLHFGQLNLFSTQWLPLVILLLSQAMEAPAPRNWFLFGFFFCLSALSSFYYAFFTATSVGVYWLVAWTAERKRFGWRLWIPFGITLAGVLLLLVGVAFPYFQLARDYRLERMRFELSLYKASPLDYFVSFVKNPLSDFIQTLAPSNGENTLAPGLLASVLALYYAVISIRAPRTLALLLIAIVGFVMSLGVETQIGGVTILLPAGLLYDFAPGIGSAMRVTARWGLLVLFAAAVLAAFGLNDLYKRMEKRSPIAAWATTAVLILVLAVEYNPAPITLGNSNVNTAKSSPLYQWLAAQPPSPIVELPMGLPTERNSADVWYQFQTLFDNQRRMNGASGFAPPFNDQVARTLEHFPSAESVGMLQQLGVRYVVVHTDELSDSARVREQLNLFSDSVQLAQRFDNAQVYEIKPAPSDGALGLKLELPSQIAPLTAEHGYLIASGAPAQTIQSSARGSVQIDVQWIDSLGNPATASSSLHAIPLTLDSVPFVIPFDLRAPSASGDYTVRITTHNLNPDTRFEKMVSVRAKNADAGSTEIQLLGAILPQRAARNGEPLAVTLVWNIVTPTRLAYDAFIHVQDASGETRAQFDGAPSETSFRALQDGGILVAQYQIPLAKGLPQGRYHVIVGMFNPKTAEPVTILAPDGQSTEAVALDESAFVGAGWNQPAPRIEHPVHARFDNGVNLEGYALNNTSFVRGASIPLTLFWRARARTPVDYTVFVHLRDAAGTIVAQADAPPLAGNYPTSVWNVGEWIRDLRSIQLPNDIAPGPYTLAIGWYRADTGVRSAATLEDGNIADTIELGSVLIGQ